MLGQHGHMMEVHSIHEWQKTLRETTLVHELFAICHDKNTNEGEAFRNLQSN